MCVTATSEGSRAKIDPLWNERSGALFVLFEMMDLRSDLASTTTDGISHKITKTINAQYPCRKLEKTPHLEQISCIEMREILGSAVIIYRLSQTE
jgi:hypothetical protein